MVWWCGGVVWCGVVWRGGVTFITPRQEMVTCRLWVMVMGLIWKFRQSECVIFFNFLKYKMCI